MKLHGVRLLSTSAVTYLLFAEFLFEMSFFSDHGAIQGNLFFMLFS